MTDDSCCSTDLPAQTDCPQCDKTGPTVGTEPVKAHRPDATAGPWQHCPTSDCPVVFYLDTDTVLEDEVKAQVGTKALTKPTPVCFCFAHTPDSLEADYLANDNTSTTKAAIKAAVADGSCACEHLNPSGLCCLPEVHRALKAIQVTIKTPA